MRHWTCEVAYLPARSTWRREVAVGFDEQCIRSVRIDGQAVYAFQVHGTLIITALDNERIRFDTDALTWESEFRQHASGRGLCVSSP